MIPSPITKFLIWNRIFKFVHTNIAWALIGTSCIADIVLLSATTRHNPSHFQLQLFSGIELAQFPVIQSAPVLTTTLSSLWSRVHQFSLLLSVPCDPECTSSHYYSQFPVIQSAPVLTTTLSSLWSRVHQFSLLLSVPCDPECTSSHYYSQFPVIQSAPVLTTTLSSLWSRVHQFSLLLSSG